ncbi:H3-K4 specific histone demethylase [Aureococcus anophagefferens]|uniref:H3-K4 specific histone demethylase n=1 Tax=Aureococcus anophagefferens TaxID=44056 RepID=A0ABR1FSR7_AURAN
MRRLAAIASLALGAAASWIDDHERDASILKVSVDAGESYVAEARRFAAACGLAHVEAQVVAGFAGRYRFTLAGDVAPYRMELLLTTDGCASQEVSPLSRAAVDDLAGLGVAARDAAVGDVVLYERYGDDAAHPGHVLTAFGLAIHWAATLVGWEAGKARLLLTDARPAYDADAWLEAVAGPERRPLYRHELETKVCPRGSLCRVRRALVGFRGLDWNAWRTEPAVFAPLHRSFAAAGRRLMGRGDGAPRTRPVLIVQRLHSRVLPRAEALAAALGGDVAVLDHRPLREQMDLVDSASVVVAVDGGALDLALLARPRSGFVTIKRPHDTESPDGCRGCPTGGPEGQCCDWHLDLFRAANGTWLAAESLNPGPGLSVAVADLAAAVRRVAARLEGLPGG